MDLLSVKLFARQLCGVRQRRDVLRFFIQLGAIALLNAAALLLPRFSPYPRVAAAVGLCMLCGAAWLWCSGANLRRFYAAARSSASPLRSTWAQMRFHAALAAARGLFLLLALLPTAGMAALLSLWFRAGATRAELRLLLCGTAALLLLSLYTFAYLSSLLFFAPYLYAEGYGLRESFRTGAAVIVRQRRAWRRFRQSFAGWFLLCILILPLPFVWGYYQQSAAVFAHRLLHSVRAGLDADDLPTCPLDKWADP